MRSVVIGLAVLAGIATAAAVYFYSNATSLARASLTGGSDGVMLVEYQTTLQLTAAAIICAVILIVGSCVVHAIGVDRRIVRDATPLA